MPMMVGPHSLLCTYMRHFMVSFPTPSITMVWPQHVTCQGYPIHHLGCTTQFLYGQSPLPRLGFWTLFSRLLRQAKRCCGPILLTAGPAQGLTFSQSFLMVSVVIPWENRLDGLSGLTFSQSFLVVSVVLPWENTLFWRSFSIAKILN